MTTLARRLSWADAAFLTLGATIGAGIFRVPSLVAERLQNPQLMLSIWVFAGLIALLGAAVFAELSARRPVAGGQYAYLRDGMHPFVAFEFVWTACIVTKPAAMAAAAILFAGYAVQFAGAHVSPVPIAAAVLVLLTAVNCLGVRTCANVQNAVIILKVAGILAVIIAGLFMPIHAAAATSAHEIQTVGIAAIGAAYVLATAAYNGWHDVTAISAEIKNSGWAIGRGLFLGVGAVVALYVLTNAACIRALGTSALIATTTPASDAMRLAFGAAGQRTVAIFVMLSTLGLIYAKLLAIPRFAQAMAEDGLFFALVSRVNQKTRSPIAAVVLQGALAIIFATSLGYEQLFAAGAAGTSIFVALTALSLFTFRARDRKFAISKRGEYRLHGHPYTTLMFFTSTLAVTIASIVSYPGASSIVVIVGLAAVPLYRFWAKKRGPGIGPRASAAFGAT